MKNVFNEFLPIVQNDLNGIMLQTGVPTVTHVSSNGYYGYQAVPEKQPLHNQTHEVMDTQDCDMDIQFNNYIQPEPVNPILDRRGQANKKRMWSFEPVERDFKKRRECEPIPTIPAPPAITKHVSLRQPTHNMPDMPRCIMESVKKYYCTETKPKITKADAENRELLEELLRETHGCCSYHWLTHEL